MPTLNWKALLLLVATLGLVAGYLIGQWSLVAFLVGATLLDVAALITYLIGKRYGPKNNTNQK